ncbi:MAG TPA: hypothetical protein PLF31_00325 [Candidatus Paceibacterota bacterium]|nr:hypothetical protein [Candidatus Paceibacterota bacterium]
MDTLISSEDEHSRSLLFHANVLFEKGEYHVALNEYFNLIKVSRFKSLILSNIAFTYEIIGDVSNAQLYAKKSIEFSALEKDLAHTIDPSENLKNLIQ